MCSEVHCFLKAVFLRAGLPWIEAKVTVACWRRILGGYSDFHGNGLVVGKFQNDLAAHILTTSNAEGLPQFRCGHSPLYR